MTASQKLPESLHRTDVALSSTGTCAEAIAWQLLSEVNVAQIEALKKRANLELDEVERLLLWYAAAQAIPQLPSAPIVPAVRERLELDLQQLHTTRGSMEAGSYQFDRAARMATLRRFPAGPLEWERSGIPRSFFLQAAFPANLRMLAFVSLRLRGLVPCFFTHVAPSPRNRGLRLPKEVFRSYYRMVRSMQLQPEVRALLAHAWFHDPSALRDYPHLEPLNNPYLHHGGLITLLAPALLSSGVLEGNAQRREDYLAGRIQYRNGFGIWPRDAAIKWADAHPEFGD